MTVKLAEKLPVQVRTLEWTGLNQYDVESFIGRELDSDEGILYIDTLEGRMEASTGDIIIEGVNSEYYPCKPDIFRKTYRYV